MKALVMYCTKNGKTEAAAKRIQADFEADILKVEPAKAYGGFISSVLRARKEKKKRITVEMKTEVPDLSAYDTVFVGYPIWMSSLPGYMKGFLKQCDFKDKRIILFCTSKKSSVIPSIPDVKEVCPGSNIKEGLAFRVNEDPAYKKWVDIIRTTYC